METERQSLDLHQTPNQQTHTGNRLPIVGLTSDSNKETGNRMPIAGLMSDSNTHIGVTKEKGRPERSAHLLPTYLIWYEDQGDVVPLRRDKGLA